MDMERVRSKTMPEHTHIWRCLSTGDLPEIKLLFPHPFFIKTNDNNPIRSGLGYEYKCRASGPAVYKEKCYKILYFEDLIEKLAHCLGEGPWAKDSMRRQMLKRPRLSTTGSELCPRSGCRGEPSWLRHSLGLGGQQDQQGFPAAVDKQ